MQGSPVRLTGDQFGLSTKVEAEPGTAADVLPSGTFVVLDTEVTEDLEAEGYARDVIRAVQDERKNAGLDVADRVDLDLGVPGERLAWVKRHESLIAAETLSLSVAVHKVLSRMWVLLCQLGEISFCGVRHVYQPGFSKVFMCPWTFSESGESLQVMP
ncbi:Isoleucine--tRNA ligase [Mobiluncus mulieris]|nr:DUF5915 domain-containing protein [Mobiluncus mulieris]MCU9996614.1 hypothetical protein [Mobiluncus mulieris]STY85065.1 Isoleucine--tRNA ligase [Mobiluncus mulieris]